MNLLLYALGALSGGALGALVSVRRAELGSTLGVTGTSVGCALGTWYAIRSLASNSQDSLTLAWAIPNGALSIGIDPLSAFFLVPLFVLGGLAAVFGRSYLNAFAKTRSLALPWAAYNLLVLGMALVVVARHAVLFLIAWEIMSLCGFLLVTFEHQQASVRRAGWVYLIATHLGVLFLTVMFLLLERHAGSFEFRAMLAAHAPEAGLSALLFFLALIGFGAKAGLVPLHVWLPEAHAAAPSHVSALMSGVLIKMGIYGILRVVLILKGPEPWWGPVLIALGIGSGLFGIALAICQPDLKRVLAYSSVENVGLVTLGLGVGLWGASLGNPWIATLGLVGGLLHLWNHSVLKGLLFLGAGSILHACHTKDLQQLGGLGRRMPFTATGILFGALALSGLPPLNGFLSEWLLYSGLLRGVLDLEGANGVAVGAVIACLSVVGAAAPLCFVRLLGVGLLGEPRSSAAERAIDPPLKMIAPMAILALVGLVLAVAPALALSATEPVVEQLLGRSTAHVPLSRVGLVELGLLNAGIAIVLTLGWMLGYLLMRRRTKTSEPTWGCGYAAPTPRMQYGARSLSELFTTELLPRWMAPVVFGQAPEGPFPGPSRIDSNTTDPFTRRAYEPFFARWADRFARFRWMQQGLLHLYLVYILAALLVALAWSSVQGPGVSP